MCRAFRVTAYDHHDHNSYVQCVLSKFPCNICHPMVMLSSFQIIICIVLATCMTLCVPYYVCLATSMCLLSHKEYRLILFTLQTPFSASRMFLAARSQWTYPFPDRYTIALTTCLEQLSNIAPALLWLSVLQSEIIVVTVLVLHVYSMNAIVYLCMSACIPHYLYGVKVSIKISFAH